MKKKKERIRQYIGDLEDTITKTVQFIFLRPFFFLAP